MVRGLRQQTPDTTSACYMVILYSLYFSSARVFHSLAVSDVEALHLIRQCRFLESSLNTNFTSRILSSHQEFSFSQLKKEIIEVDFSLREFSFFRTFRRKPSFIHRTRVLTEGHWRAMRTVLFATNLGSRRSLFPIYAWKDSSFISKVVFRIHDSAPYSKIGNTQHLMMLLDESGLRVPWKVPLPLEKKTPLALLMLTDIRSDTHAHMASMRTYRMAGTWYIVCIVVHGEFSSSWCFVHDRRI